MKKPNNEPPSKPPPDPPGTFEGGVVNFRLRWIAGKIAELLIANADEPFATELYRQLSQQIGPEST